MRQGAPFGRWDTWYRCRTFYDLQFSRVRPRRKEAPSSFVQRVLHDVFRGGRPRKVSRASFCIARALTGTVSVGASPTRSPLCFNALDDGYFQDFGHRSPLSEASGVQSHVTHRWLLTVCSCLASPPSLTTPDGARAPAPRGTPPRMLPILTLLLFALAAIPTAEGVTCYTCFDQCVGCVVDGT